MLYKAEILSEEGNFEGAINIYEDLLKRYPDDESIFSALDDAYRGFINSLQYVEKGTTFTQDDIKKLTRCFKKEGWGYNYFYRIPLFIFYSLLFLLMGVSVLVDSFLTRRGEQQDA